MKKNDDITGGLGMNPRIRNYARVHGRTVREQMEIDRKRWPGGPMFGYTMWNTERLREFSMIYPDGCFFSDSGRPHLVDHRAYDRWLDSLPAVPNEVRNLTPAYADPEMIVYDEVA